MFMTRPVCKPCPAMICCVGSPDGAEPLSVERAFRAIRRSDVVALVIDAVDGITQQDFRCGLGSDPDRVAFGVPALRVQCTAVCCYRACVWPCHNSR